MTKELVSLTNLDKAIIFIQRASVAQLEELIGQAEAFRVYAIQSKKGLELSNQATEIKLRAERKLSEWWQKQPKNKGAVAPLQPRKTIKELGLEKTKLHRLKAIASLPDKEFEKHIAEVKASNKELTTIGIINLARKFNQPNFKKPPELPIGKFDVLYADPSWHYDFSPSIVLNIEQHYPTMTTEEICGLKVPSADNAVLFLWATNPKLEEALQVMNAWGFSYKTNACWDKQKPTFSKMGYWFFGQHELLLVGTKGNFSPPAPENRVSSLYSEKKTKHSKKPDYYYQLIEKMFPQGKYLELFHRGKKRDKWECWGNENV